MITLIVKLMMETGKVWAFTQMHQAYFVKQNNIEPNRGNRVLAVEDLLRQGHQASVDFTCEWRPA